LVANSGEADGGGVWESDSVSLPPATLAELDFVLADLDGKLFLNSI
jgi:hypothetical protein